MATPLQSSRERGMTSPAKWWAGLLTLGITLAGSAATLPDAVRISRTFAPHVTASDGSFSNLINAPAAHGGFYLAGTFTGISGQSTYGLARFRADGVFDSNFVASESFLGVEGSSERRVARVSALAIQPDGKVLAAYLGKPTPQSANVAVLVRLNPNGSIDPGFSAVLFDSTSVADLEVLSDGKVIAVGEFQTVNGLPRSRLVRLAADGTVDSSFAPPAAIAEAIQRVTSAPDGAVYVASLNQVVRLASDGSADDSFPITIGTYNATRVDLAVQPDGKLLVAGRFSVIAGTSAGSIARFNPDGTRDFTFDVGAGFTTRYGDPAEVGAVVVQPDGRIVVLTDAYYFKGATVGEVVRLFADGTHDRDFVSDVPNFWFGFGATMGGLIRLPNGEFVAMASSRSWKVGANGAVDPDTWLGPKLPGVPTIIARANDGQWLIGSFNGYFSAAKVVRVEADGSADKAFQPTLSYAEYEISSLTVAPTGSCLLATRYLAGGPKAIHSANLTRVTANGTIDTSFNPTEPLPYPAHVTPDSSGRAVVWGGAWRVQISLSLPPSISPSLQRLNANGSPDSNFSPGDAITSRNVVALGLQSTGRMIVSLAATESESARFLRLTVNGSNDGSFSTGSGFDGEVQALAIQPDDKIIVVGNFSHYRGDAVPRLVRLQANGARDTTFLPGSGFDRVPAKVYVLSDGTILFAGNFSSYQGKLVSGLARVKTDGSLDANFTINGSRTTFGSVVACAEGSNGTLLVLVPGYWMPGLDPNSAGVLLLESAAKPQFTTQPVAASVVAGGATTLSVTAESSEPLSYQWQLDGVNIPGATSAAYSLPSVQAFHAGQYRVIVSAGGFSTTSHAAGLSVAPAPSSGSELVNLSTRALCLTGDGVLVPGFVVEGTATKRLLLRAVGSTLGLAPFGLTGVLPNPRMTLKRRNDAGVFEDVASNNDWGANANVDDILATAARLSAFALNDPREAALLLDVVPGQYTVIADDVAGASGTAIVEIYDADETPSGARVINLSNRGFAGRGEQVMIPGFVVSSEGAKTVLIRVAGPALATPPFNVNGAMIDPAMSVYRSEPGGGSTLLFRNDNWDDGPGATQITAVAEQVFAFPLAAGSRDAAIVATLEPGVYTVHGAAADGVSTGVVLVEVYVVP
jgi:uncharacterized delta-60 repeat protein